jgi:sugar lactone lactonase YvrE
MTTNSPQERVSLLVEGLGVPESTRWRDGRVWLCNWGAGEVLVVTPGGEQQVIAQLAPETLPFSIGWLPDGRLLAVDGPRRLLLQLEPDGALAPVADLSSLGEGAANELVVDAAGNAYVNGGAGSVVRVTPDGGVDKIADGSSSQTEWTSPTAVAR